MVWPILRFSLQNITLSGSILICAVKVISIESDGFFGSLKNALNILFIPFLKQPESSGGMHAS